jgi:hypothetical protein
VAGLANGTAYTFTVTATNRRGDRTAVGGIEQRHARHASRARRESARRHRRNASATVAFTRPRIERRRGHHGLHGNRVAGRIIHRHVAPRRATLDRRGGPRQRHRIHLQPSPPPNALGTTAQQSRRHRNSVTPTAGCGHHVHTGADGDGHGDRDGRALGRRRRLHLRSDKRPSSR